MELNRHVHHYVHRRSRGEPLQYILGSEFVGDLEIKCRPGVLIPRFVRASICSSSFSSDSFVHRQETAASVTHLVNLLLSSIELLPADLRVLDLCTGSGCIPLLFYHEFYSKYRKMTSNRDVFLDLVGLDISSIAINLAEENQVLQLAALNSKSPAGSLQFKSLKAMTFLQADILRNKEKTDPREPQPLLQALRGYRNNGRELAYDILISNPPYISTSDYWRITSPSVRNFEPKLALVPPPSTNNTQFIHDGDLFYHYILRAAQQLNAQVLLLEVGNLDQAERVASFVVQQGIWDGVEIWRDDPNNRSQGRTPVLQLKHNNEDVVVPIRGSGEGRSVLAYGERGASWLSKA